MEPLDESAQPRSNPDPAALDLPPTFEVEIDVAALLSARAASTGKLHVDSFERSAELRDHPRIEPILGLISRSIEGALEFLELPHLRVLVLLYRRDSMSVVELSALMKMRTHRMFTLLDSMEGSGWIASHSRARGVGESIAISQLGREVIAAITTKRQGEIDEILGRMSDQDRTDVARAFNAFASAAAEVPVPGPKPGIAP